MFMEIVWVHRTISCTAPVFGEVKEQCTRFRLILALPCPPSKLVSLVTRLPLAVSLVIVDPKIIESCPARQEITVTHWHYIAADYLILLLAPIHMDWYHALKYVCHLETAINCTGCGRWPIRKCLSVCSVFNIQSLEEKGRCMRCDMVDVLSCRS